VSQYAQWIAGQKVATLQAIGGVEWGEKENKAMLVILGVLYMQCASKSNDFLHALFSRDKLEMYPEVMRRLDGIVDNFYSIPIRFIYSNHLDCSLLKRI
jgi:hypothetical protein